MSKLSKQFPFEHKNPHTQKTDYFLHDQLERVQKEDSEKYERLVTERDRLQTEKTAAETRCMQHEAEVVRLKDGLDTVRKELTLLTAKLAESEKLHATAEQLEKDL